MAPLAREPLVAEAPAPAFWKTELKTMWNIGWPMSVSFFCRFAMMSMDAAFVGHIRADHPHPAVAAGPGLGMTGPLAFLAGEGGALSGMMVGADHAEKEYLAGASLSDMLTQVMTIPLLAMGFGIGPLVGQALGAGNSKMAGTWTQISIFCITVAALPFHVAFFFVGDVLAALGFNADLCSLAGQYAKFSVIWVIPNSWFVALRFYFQAQGMARPAMYSGLIFLGVNALLNWVFVFGGPLNPWLGWAGFGFIGAAISISCSRTLQCFTYWLYMFVWRGAHCPTWPGWSFAFLKAEYMRPFLAQTLPQVGTLLLQIAINQSVTLLVARLGTLAVASSSAATNGTMPFSMFFMATLSALSGMRVGFHLGSGEAELAKRTAWMVLGLGTATMVVFAAVVLPLRVELMAVITSDKQVQALAAQILPAVLLNWLATSLVNCGTTGILASQGRTRLSTFLSLGFELPLSLGTIALLVLVFEADVRVVYWTQALASVVEAVVVLQIVRRSDWNKHAEEARARQQVPRRGSGTCRSSDEETPSGRSPASQAAELRQAQRPSAASSVTGPPSASDKVDNAAEHQVEGRETTKAGV